MCLLLSSFQILWIREWIWLNDYLWYSHRAFEALASGTHWHHANANRLSHKKAFDVIVLSHYRLYHLLNIYILIDIIAIAWENRLACWYHPLAKHLTRNETFHRIWKYTMLRGHIQFTRDIWAYQKKNKRLIYSAHHIGIVLGFYADSLVIWLFLFFFCSKY